MNRDTLLSYTSVQLAIRDHWQSQLKLARNLEPGRLLAYGHKAYSQNDEDGIIQEIFRRIGTTDKRFVEFGIGNGLECNSLLLLLGGWSGGWMEPRKAHVDNIRTSHRQFLESGRLQLSQTIVTPENVDTKIAAFDLGSELDLLSIDVDFHDYWIWEAVTKHRPRVVVIEYNASWMPPLSITVPYSQDTSWTGTNYFGASLEALSRLGKKKGYLLVGCCFAGVNAFFVREDLCGDHFHAPGDASEHYEPARYFMSMLASGHPTGLGPIVAV